MAVRPTFPRRPGPIGASRRRLWSAVLLAAGLVLLAFAGIGLWQRYRATHGTAVLPAATRTVTVSESEPDETPPARPDDYKVPAGQPRRVIIPSIGAEGLVEKVGLDQHNAVAVPTNVHYAGWYAHGAVPGDTGVSLIDGHVQGRYQPGVFKRLVELKQGDRIEVEFGDRTRRSFEVVRSQSYDADDVARHMLEPQDIGRQLNLITCDGAYDRASGQYEKRLLVITRRTD